VDDFADKDVWEVRVFIRAQIKREHRYHYLKFALYENSMNMVQQLVSKPWV